MRKLHNLSTALYIWAGHEMRSKSAGGENKMKIKVTRTNLSKICHWNIGADTTQTRKS